MTLTITASVTTISGKEATTMAITAGCEVVRCCATACSAELKNREANRQSAETQRDIPVEKPITNQRERSITEHRCSFMLRPPNVVNVGSTMWISAHGLLTRCNFVQYIFLIIATPRPFAAGYVIEHRLHHFAMGGTFHKSRFASMAAVGENPERVPSQRSF